MSDIPKWNASRQIKPNKSRPLVELQDHYRLLIESVGDYAIFLLDPTGRVSTWNKGAQKIKQYTADEIIGRHFSVFYPQEANDRNYPQQELEWAVAQGRWEDQGWRLRRDGSLFWANVVITPIFGDDKALLGFSKVTRDLTDRKLLEEQLCQAHEELKESEERVRLLIDSVKDYAILMLSPTGEILTWNIGAERIKGYTVSEIIGKHFSLFYSREAIESGFPQFELERALETGRFEDEGWRLRKDGTAFWANVVLSPIFNSSGRHLGFSKITRDLTEKRRNEELMNKNQELVRLNRDLDNFVYAASHDLKSPITNLEGLINELKASMGPDLARYEDLMPWIDNTLKSLKKVVGDLAEVIRLDQAGRTPEAVDLTALLREVTDSLRDQLQARGAVLSTDFTKVPVLAYSRKNLRSVLFNLVSNAIKYADPDRPPNIQVSTQLLAQCRQVLLTVQDNGLGIPEDQQAKIFTMFRRYHTHVEGSGVGLYLVKKILGNQGDQIEVVSEPGKGSCFRVYFNLR